MPAITSDGFTGRSNSGKPAQFFVTRPPLNARKSFLRERFARATGFTLIELLVVIAILAALLLSALSKANAFSRA
jgi:prepilin-type N-terminal cleavage/methylation domain-containing protein